MFDNNRCFYFFIVLIIISYALSIFSVGQILIFNVFQKRIGVDFLKLNIQPSSFSDDDFNMTNNEETLKGNKDEDLSN